MTHVRANQFRRKALGFSLVEMMVAIAVGLVLISVMSVVYVNSKSSSRRQEQLSNIQQSVRTAFEFVAFDARMVGHLGCFTGHTGLVNVGALDVTNNFGAGIEGYEYVGTAPGSTYAMTSATPTDSTDPNAWSASPGATTAAIPLTSISGGAAVGLTPGSDVMILRSASSGKPVRLTAPVLGGSATTIPVENTSTGSCPNGAANVAGFCDGSFGVIANCTAAQAFRVTTAGASLTLQSLVQGGVVYATNGTEVFPMQTVVYYVKRSSNGTTTSLYRRVFDGRLDAGGNPVDDDQELIEGVESMQLRYALDTDAEPDGLINGDYVTANSVVDWSQVIAVRVSLLMRAQTEIERSLTAASAPVNGVSVSFPTTGPAYDRRVFTTTIALRNRIAYAAP